MIFTFVSLHMTFISETVQWSSLHPPLTCPHVSRRSPLSPRCCPPRSKGPPHRRTLHMSPATRPGPSRGEIDRLVRQRSCVLSLYSGSPLTHWRSQCTTIWRVGMGISPSNTPSFSVMRQLARSCLSAQVSAISTQVNESPSRPASCAVGANTASPGGIISANPCGSRAALKPSPTWTGRCRTA